MQADNVPHGPILPIVVSLTPAATAASVEVNAQSFTVPGVLPGDIVHVTGPSAPPANLGLLGACLVTAANTLTVYWVNATASAKTPPAGSYSFAVVRP